MIEHRTSSESETHKFCTERTGWEVVLSCVFSVCHKEKDEYSKHHFPLKFSYKSNIYHVKHMPFVLLSCKESIIFYYTFFLSLFLILQVEKFQFRKYNRTLQGPWNAWPLIMYTCCTVSPQSSWQETLQLDKLTGRSHHFHQKSIHTHFAHQHSLVEVKGWETSFFC